MSIVRMKRLRMLALEKDRDSMIELLQRLGCVQIDAQAGKLADPEWAVLSEKPETGLESARNRVQTVKNALDVLTKYAGLKESMIKKLFTPRPEMTLPELQKEEFIDGAVEDAGEILERAGYINSLSAERGRIENKLSALNPWRSLDIPLDFESTPFLSFCPGICTATADMEELGRLLREESPAAEFFLINRGETECHIVVLYHPSAEDETLGILKSFGFSRMDFKDITGTALENIEVLKRRLREIGEEQEAAKKGLSDYAPRAGDLKQAFDALNVRMQREEAAEKLIVSGSVFYLEGWAPEKVVPALEKLLDRYECAYESREPEPGDEPPVLLQTQGWYGNVTEPSSMVTEMYSLPKYGNIDPNPLIAPFFIIFFGMMYADTAYGIILMILGFLVTRKGNPKGMVGKAFRLIQFCGLSTAIFGLVFGGFFADAVTVAGDTFFGASWAFPTLWVSPTDYANNGPMTVLIFSMVLGMVQIITGMIVKGYILIRDGHPFDAVMQIIPWWCFFAGVALTATVGGVHWIIGGLALLVLTQGYQKKGIIKKLAFGIVSLYDLTSYLGDILSYSRLMALGLAGGVIGSVFNKLGAMPGQTPVIGPVIFIIIFLFGHIFNMAINIIGTFVHAARLQYVEFFTKFYDAPGEPFRPLRASTKYVDVVERL